jgi:DNA-binding transcriptional LysR family regulator
MFEEVAEEVLRTLRQAREEVQAIAKQADSVVSFAVTHSLSLTFFPQWLRRIEREIGPLSIALFSHDAERCREAVIEGRCQFMICHFDPRMTPDYEARRIRSLPVGRDRLIPVRKPSRDARFADLPGRPNAHIPYLAYTKGSSIGRSLELFLQDKVAYIEPRFRTSLADAIKGMIMEGEGMGWLPEASVKNELESGQLVRAGDVAWDVDVEIRAFRTTTKLPDNAEKLWAAMSKPRLQSVNRAR